MTKDYSDWHAKKTEIENKEDPRVFFHEREVWFCSLGKNIGDEEDGQGEQYLRPVVILKKFNKNIFWAVALTRTIKKLPFYYIFRIQDKGVPDERESSAIVSQIRLIDAKRLKYSKGYIGEEDFKRLKEKIRQFLA